MKKLSSLLITFFFLLLLIPLAMYAQGEPSYDLLAPLPLSGTNNVDPSTTASDYIEGIVKLAVALSGALAVIMLIAAGIEYMSVEAVTGKSDAKEKIQNALVGLLLVIASFTILSTIDSKFLNFTLDIAPQDIREKLDGGLGEDKTKENENNDQTYTSDGQKRACENVGGKNVGVTGQCAIIQPPLKLKEGACAKTQSNDPCVLNQTLRDKLLAMDIGLRRTDVKGDFDDVKWRITEAYPPSSQGHVNPCHYNGTCIDAGRDGGGIMLVADIKTFIEEASKQGLRAMYEVRTAERRNQLIEAGVPEASLERPLGDHISAEHFSVYMSGSAASPAPACNDCVVINTNRVEVYDDACSSPCMLNRNLNSRLERLVANWKNFDQGYLGVAQAYPPQESTGRACVVNGSCVIVVASVESADRLNTYLNSFLSRIVKEGGGWQASLLATDQKMKEDYISKDKVPAANILIDSKTPGRGYFLLR